MSADLHIHILEGITEEDVAAMNYNVLGSKHFDLNKDMERHQKDPDMKLYKKISDTPNIWIGEVSWLSAALTGNTDTIPSAIMTIQKLVGEEYPVIDDNFIVAVRGALEAPNLTGYNINTFDKVHPFLLEHKGKKVFRISW